MSSLFRSESMTLCQLFIQSESAFACVSELGELGLIQFCDLNIDVNAFQRKFVNEVRRCSEMERQLHYMENEIKKEGIIMLEASESVEAPPPREMIELESIFEKLENELREINHNIKELKKHFIELTELKHVLRKTQIFLDEQESQGTSTPESLSYGLIPNESRLNRGGNIRLSFIAGVIARERMPAFEKMLWRACHGNVFLRQTSIDTPLEDPNHGSSEIYKSVFIIYLQGEQLRSRVMKICDGFRATIYPCPELAADRREMAMEVMTRIEDLTTIMGQSDDHRYRILIDVAKSIRTWIVKICKIKAIYHTLNNCNVDVTQKCLIAECWIPVVHIEDVQLALRRGTERSGSSIPSILNRIDTLESPPTYNRLNKFTSGFQNLIDAYGVARYREINPAPYTIITFPFLFAVMFGDIGHGLILTLVSLWMLCMEKQLTARKSNNEIWNIFFGGRYIIFLMGIFSIYTGFIYNDCFSKSLNIFGSRWRINYNSSTVMSNKVLQLDPGSDDSYLQTPYPFGMDPIWQAARGNKIIFQNAYKMKISIIFGVAHMIFGVVLSLYNYRYTNDRLAIIYEFIPQIIFLIVLFFYMVLLMFIKWFKYSASNEPPNSAGCAPSILITFINMVLFKRPNTPQADCKAYFYPGEEIVEKLLVVIALICVPWMLLSRPIHIMRKRKFRDEQQSKQEEPVANGDVEVDFDDTEQSVANCDSVEHDEEEEISEIFIHQAIHTVEYVLGCVSHTASYLRLWALSLAHAQLSEVLWNMVLGKIQHIPILAMPFFVLCFALWAVFTVAILVLMEGLSAFLHTLRLHWVEFQSKFYSGDGYCFRPFAFKTILEVCDQTSAEK